MGTNQSKELSTLDMDEPPLVFDEILEACFENKDRLRFKNFLQYFLWKGAIGASPVDAKELGKILEMKCFLDENITKETLKRRVKDILSDCVLRFDYSDIPLSDTSDFYTNLAGNSSLDAIDKKEWVALVKSKYCKWYGPFYLQEKDTYYLMRIDDQGSNHCTVILEISFDPDKDRPDRQRIVLIYAQDGYWASPRKKFRKTDLTLFENFWKKVGDFVKNAFNPEALDQLRKENVKLAELIKKSHYKDHRE